MTLLDPLGWERREGLGEKFNTWGCPGEQGRMHTSVLPSPRGGIDTWDLLEKEKITVRKFQFHYIRYRNGLKGWWEGRLDNLTN